MTTKVTMVIVILVVTTGSCTQASSIKQELNHSHRPDHHCNRRSYEDKDEPSIFPVELTTLPTFENFTLPAGESQQESIQEVFTELPPDNSTSPAWGFCECSVFDTDELADDAVPIFTQNPLNTTCNKTGEDACLQLCTALAHAASSRGPALLCLSVGHAVNLKAFLFSRVCDLPYSFTGFSSTDPICCHDNYSVAC